MSRLAMCLFLIAIFHNGILKVAHANETTSEDLPKTNEEEEVESKPIVVEEPKDEESKVEESNVEESKVEESNVEESKVEESKVEESKVEESKVEESKVEDEVPLKLEPQAISEEPLKAEPKEVVHTIVQKIAFKPIEEKDASNKDGNTEDTFLGPPLHTFPSIPMKHTQVFFQIPVDALGQSAQALNIVSGHLGTAVAKSLNTAKLLLTAPFGMLQTAVNTDYK